jgi:hypothetical protein
MSSAAWDRYLKAYRREQMCRIALSLGISLAFMVMAFALS